MVRRTKEEAQETRSRILDAAEQVFHARGVSRPSLTDIADAAGVTRGAIYWHFKNKSDVFSAMCDRIHLPMETLCDPASSDCADDPLGHVRKLTLYVFRETARNPQRRRVFEIIFHKCELVEDVGPIVQRHQEAHQRAIERITERLTAAVNKGQLPVDLNTPLAVSLFHSSLNGILANWLLNPNAFDLVLEAERLTDALLDTLRNAPALRTTYRPPAA